MTSVDSRIVTMKFDNRQFERDVKTTMSTMDRLKASLNFGNSSNKFLRMLSVPINKKIASLNPWSGAKQGVDDLQKATNSFQIGGIDGKIINVSKRFLTLATIGITALSSITNKAIASGTAFVNSFTVAPILDGLHEYETNLKSIQTIQANTDRPLPEINNALQELNKYSDQTIYNFSEMAKNIGTFTAAGVDLKTATSSIKGIANLAALSGSSSEQAANAMYQLSQAISSGKVGLQDWNSVVNAGMGGKKLQNALAQTAISMGVLDDKSVTLSGRMKSLKINGTSFRDSIAAKPGDKPWLTSEVLTNTLAALDGRFSLSALLAEKNANGLQKYTKAEALAIIQTNRRNMELKNGVKYSDDQFEALKKLSTSSFKAATEVKTLGQVFDVAKETIGSGWSASFQNIFGDFAESKKTFTNMSNFVNDIINRNSMARNQILVDWNKDGGRTAGIDAIKNAFAALMSVIKPIQTAFREIFPSKTGKDLANITKSIRDFTEGLLLGKGSSQALHDTFKGVFSVLSIGVMILKGVLDYWLSLFGILAGGSGGILNLTASIGKLLTKLRDWLAEGDKIGAFFDRIIEGRAKILKPIIEFVTRLINAMAGLLTTGAEKAFDWLESLAPYAEQAQVLIDGLKEIARSKAQDALAMIQHYMALFGEWIDKVTPKIQAWLMTVNPISRLVQEISNSFRNLSQSGGDSFVDRLRKSFSNLGPMLAGLGGDIKRSLSAAVKAIGKLDLGSIFERNGSTSVNSAGLDGLQNSLQGVASTSDVVKRAWSSLVESFNRLGDFLKPVVDGIKAVFSYLKDRFRNFASDLGVEESLATINTGFFIALYIMLRSFIKKMGGLVESVTEVMGHIGGVLDQTTSYLKTMQSDVRSNIILKIAGALALLAVALLVLSRIPLKQLGQSLGAVAALLIMLTIAMRRMQKQGATIKSGANMVLVSAALVGLSGAILILSAAVAVLSRIDPKSLAVGLGGVATLLAVMVGAIKGLENTGGAKQLVIAAAGMTLMAAAMITMVGAVVLFSKIPMDTLENGGLKVAVTLGVLVAILTRLPPGAAILAGAAAVFVIANALIILVAAMKAMGTVTTGEFLKSWGILLFILPTLARATQSMTGSLPGAAAMLVIAASLIVFSVALGALGSLPWSVIATGLGVLASLLAVLAVAGLTAPAISALGGALLILGAGFFLTGSGLFLFASGIALLAASGTVGVAALTASVLGVAQLFPLIMQQVGLGVVALALVFEKAAPQLVHALGVVLIKLIQEIIRITPHFVKMLYVFIVEGLKAIRKAIPDFVATGFAILVAFLRGVRDNIDKIVPLVGTITARFLISLGKQIPKLTDAGVKFIISFINGISQAIEDNEHSLNRAGTRLAWALIRGMASGLWSGASVVGYAAMGVAKKALDGALKFLQIRSPSRKFREIGMNSSLGLAEGLESYSGVVERAGSEVAETALSTITATMARIPDVVSRDINLNPTITPVLDLTKMANDASQINGLLSTNPISADVSLSRASSISSSTQAAREAAENAAGMPPIVQEIKFEQNNNSPKALSSVEIYRQTKNQLSLAKEALKA